MYSSLISTSWWKGHGKNSPKTWKNKTRQTWKQCQGPRNVKTNMPHKAWLLTHSQQQRHLELGLASSSCSPPPKMVTRLPIHKGPQYHIESQSSPWKNCC